MVFYIASTELPLNVEAMSRREESNSRKKRETLKQGYILNMLSNYPIKAPQQIESASKGSEKGEKGASGGSVLISEQ